MLGKISKLILKKRIHNSKVIYFCIEVLNVVIFFHFLPSILQNAKGAVYKERISIETHFNFLMTYSFIFL